MKIGRQELERLIKEELREALEQYPADAMAEITATIFSLADQAGVETTGDQREGIVGEIEELLKAEGFELHEQGLVFAEPLNLDLSGTKLGALCDNIISALPSAYNQIIKAFERGGIDLGVPLDPEDDEIGAPEPEPDDEDLTSTITTPPVSPPEEEDDEDLTSTIVTPPVDIPEEDPEEPDKPGIIDKIKDIKNPWAFKYFWQEDEEDEEDQPDWIKKAVKGVKGVLGGSSTSIKVLGGLTGIAGILGLMKYLAKDEEKIDEAGSLQKGKDLEELGKVEPWSPSFITSTLKFALSLTLDEEQMKTVDLVEDVIRIGTRIVFSDDSDRQEEINAALYKALDKIPGIEWVDKLPGGRERIVEIIRERWDEMSTSEQVKLIVALLPQDIVVKLEALIPGPDLSEMDMRWPEVEPELSDWFAEGGVDHNNSFEAWDNLPGMLLNAGEMFGLLDPDQVRKAMAILFVTDLALQDAKDDSNMERMMKIMDALFEHKKQLNRMKVLAGVR